LIPWTVPGQAQGDPNAARSVFYIKNVLNTEIFKQTGASVRILRIVINEMIYEITDFLVFVLKKYYHKSPPPFVYMPDWDLR
jgi:hypothetical protein